MQEIVNVRAIPHNLVRAFHGWGDVEPGIDYNLIKPKTIYDRVYKVVVG